MPIPISWLLDHLASEGAAIKQAPLTFILILVFSFAISYLLLRWIFRDILTNKDALILSLKENPVPGALSTISSQDRKAINRVVLVVNYLVGNPGLSDPDHPYLNFQFKVFNGSVYDISVERQFQGYMMFQGRAIKGRLEMLPEDQNVENLKHGELGTFGIRLWIEPAPQAETIREQYSTGGGEALWDFSYLTVMIAGEGFTSKPLSFDLVRYR